ncbi:MAG: helix-turn-helix transcriptional regulator [Lachnospiraceae bacterium]|nr:helix-turn-helix transcriptional regulator [Lachnospiraceae bacterium]
MKKHTLRILLGTAYVFLLTILLLYQAGLFGGRREWMVAVLGTLLLGVALAVVLALYLRVNDRIAKLEEHLCVGKAGRETGTDKDTVMPGTVGEACTSAGKDGLFGSGNTSAVGDSRSAPRSYEEIYACFLAVMEACALSERELEVAWLLYRGYTNRQIGEALYIAETTVKKHVSHIYQKMGVCSRKEFRGRVRTGSLSGSHPGG